MSRLAPLALCLFLTGAGPRADSDHPVPPLVTTISINAETGVGSSSLRRGVSKIVRKQGGVVSPLPFAELIGQYEIHISVHVKLVEPDQWKVFGAIRIFIADRHFNLIKLWDCAGYGVLASKAEALPVLERWARDNAKDGVELLVEYHKRIHAGLRGKRKPGRIAGGLPVEPVDQRAQGR